MFERENPVKRALHGIERSSRWAIRPLRDHLENRRHLGAGERILLVRHRVHITSYYRSLLNWMAEELPSVRPYFELRTLPCRDVDWSRTRLVVPWVSENLASRSALVHGRLNDLERRCGDHDVPVINPVAATLKALKLTAARLIAEAGMRTPRIERIQDLDRFRQDLEGLAPPLLIRENRSHGGKTPTYLVHSAEETADLPLERFEEPIASEFIDVRNPADGYYRKYRFMVAGDQGVPSSLQIGRHWEVRGRERALNKATRDEEIAYMENDDPNAERFQHVRRYLGLDSLAFDYSYTPAGQPVVWEINVLPGLGLLTDPRRLHVNVGLRRSMACLVHLYLTRAGLPVPDELEGWIRTGQRPSRNRVAA